MAQPEAATEAAVAEEAEAVEAAVGALAADAAADGPVAADSRTAEAAEAVAAVVAPATAGESAPVEDSGRPAEPPAAAEATADCPADSGASLAAPVAPRPKKQESTLGLSLGRALTVDSEQKPNSATARSLEITAKLSAKYAANVRQSEQQRLDRLVPLDRRTQLPPDSRDTMKNVKSELDAVSSEDLGSMGAWDKLLGSDAFQQRMQFLCENARTGNCIEQYGADGSYDGDFLYGMRHGSGRHEFRGETYEGEWKWDQRHGRGTLTTNDGAQVKGDWRNGKPDGCVTMTDAKGTITYEGEFKEGKRHGLGRQVFESGDVYDGGWQNGRLNDRGVYHFSNGDKLYGMWSEGLYDGVGVFHYADGAISRRTYRKGLLISVQDYEKTAQRFGKTLTREGMQRHTGDEAFPKDVFLLNGT